MVHQSDAVTAINQATQNKKISSPPRPIVNEAKVTTSDEKKSLRKHRSYQ